MNIDKIIAYEQGELDAAHEFANDHISVEWLAVALDAQNQYISEVKS